MHEVVHGYREWASVQGALYLLVLLVNSVLVITRGLVSAPGEGPCGAHSRS